MTYDNSNKQHPQSAVVLASTLHTLKYDGEFLPTAKSCLIASLSPPLPEKGQVAKMGFRLGTNFGQISPLTMLRQSTCS